MRIISEELCWGHLSRIFHTQNQHIVQDLIRQIHSLEHTILSLGIVRIHPGRNTQVL